MIAVRNKRIAAWKYLVVQFIPGNPEVFIEALQPHVADMRVVTAAHDEVMISYKSAFSQSSSHFHPWDWAAFDPKTMKYQGMFSDDQLNEGYEVDEQENKR